jgi:hypothetical protein
MEVPAHATHRVRVGDQVTAIGATEVGGTGAFTAASVTDQTAH